MEVQAPYITCIEKAEKNVLVSYLALSDGNLVGSLRELVIIW